MSTIADSLLAKDIHPLLKAIDHRDALEELLFPLRSDPRVSDLEKLRAALHANPPSDNFGGDTTTLLLHHGRTESVSSLILAIGRSRDGFLIHGHQQRIHLIFVAAIPEALNNEYLRILGAISRVCQEHATLAGLLAAKDRAEILGMLEKGCLQ